VPMSNATTVKLAFTDEKAEFTRDKVTITQHTTDVSSSNAHVCGPLVETAVARTPRALAFVAAGGGSGAPDNEGRDARALDRRLPPRSGARGHGFAAAATEVPAGTVTTASAASPTTRSGARAVHTAILVLVATNPELQDPSCPAVRPGPTRARTTTVASSTRVDLVPLASPTTR
jgi:hypothetical protein